MNQSTYECGDVMPLTIEAHFYHLAQKHPSVMNLYSLWTLLRKDLAEQTEYSLSTFVHYSIHNASHSMAVIQAIERFLGEERICQLSPTDTFMILCCAYAHDYGMAVTLGHYYRILKRPDLEQFLRKQSVLPLEPEEEQAVHYLLEYLDDTQGQRCLGDMYVSIITVMEMYLRPSHWKGVRMFWDDFEGLFKNRLKGRFIHGREGIVEICESHGKPFDSLLEMSIRADGIVGDNFHPRFIAAMLRLGDLLDLDNGRFPRWFVMELTQKKPTIPKLSILNYYKHQAVSHLMITPKKIEISASCSTQQYGYEVACLISEWIEWLVDECENQTKYWSRITQPDFGRPPLVSERIIYLDDHLFTSGHHPLQLIMPQDRVMKLLKGTSIYSDPYVCIRETVQNAVDASLLQLWLDITENRYNGFCIDKYGRFHARWSSNQVEDSSPIKLWEMDPENLLHIISHYDINVELILDRSRREYNRDVVLLVIKDRGLGILPDDVRFMTNLGSSKEENYRIAKIIKSMPDWLKPAGIFGIGLQSAFQLTDEIDFFTRVPGEPERRIVLHSYGRSKGRVEIREVDPTQPVVFYDNSLPGTNLRICVDSRKVLAQDPEQGGKNRLLYYDSDFSPADDVDIIFEEMRGAVERTLISARLDYFNIFFQTIKIDSNNTVHKHDRRRIRSSFFCPFQKLDQKRNKLTEYERRIFESSYLVFKGKKTTCDQDGEQFYQYHYQFACMIDGSTNRFYKMSVRICRHERQDGQLFLELPERIHSPYSFQYKFSPLDDVNLYPADSTRPSFTRMEIQIMDSNAAKYVNIDREHLRRDAFSMDELSEIEKKIALHWCNYLIHYETTRKLNVSHSNTKGLAAKKISGEEEKFRSAVYYPKYFSKPEIVVSLALLFYQYVPASIFRQFLEPYESFFANCKITLTGENFPIRDLWDPEIRFCCSDTLCSEDPAEPAVPISMRTLRSLPDRMFQVYKIQGSEERGRRYFLQTCKSADTFEGINMDDDAVSMDYKLAMDKGDGDSEFRILDSVVHRVLMPNRKFPNLIIYRYPKHFSKGENFRIPMADYINGCIISPFNRDMTQVLLRELRACPSGETSDDFNQQKRDAVIRNIISIVEQDRHFHRCIEYTFNQRLSYCLTDEEKRQCTEGSIHDDFVRLIKDYCQFLFTNRDIVISK